MFGLEFRYDEAIEQDPHEYLLSILPQLTMPPHSTELPKPFCGKVTLEVGVWVCKCVLCLGVEVSVCA